MPLTVFLGLIELDLLISILTHDFMPQAVDILQSRQLLTPALIAEALAPLAVPIFTYIAILKYRLYDIDVVINRTLVYGSLSAILVALYFGGIVVL